MPVLLTQSDLNLLSYVYNALHCYLTTDHVAGSLGTQYFLYYRLDDYTYTYVSIGVSLHCHMLLPTTYDIPCVCIYTCCFELVCPLEYVRIYYL